MPRKNTPYMHGVDELITATPLARVLEHYGQPLPEQSSGEHRMTCPFSAECRASRYGNMAVNLDTSARLIYAHCCGIRGNLLTLIYGLETGRPPSTDKLRGDEFKLAVTTLRRINGVGDAAAERTGSPDGPQSSPANRAADAGDASPLPQSADEPPVNIPLKDIEKAAALVNLWEECVVDPADMPPDVAAYFRRRPWLTPEVCRKWKMGYLPRDGRSLLRGLIIYAHENAAGEILSYSGRDVQFEKKYRDWLANGQPEQQRPHKHRYVKGYHRGLELYGQQAYRLQDRRLKESLGRHGLVVVEGQNDVIRLDCLGIAAVALCSNQATDAQLDKLETIARGACNGRLLLMPDNDPEGEAGAKDLLWHLASRGLTVHLAWSRTSHGGKFEGMQPEDLRSEQWEGLCQ